MYDCPIGTGFSTLKSASEIRFEGCYFRLLDWGCSGQVDSMLNYR